MCEPKRSVLRIISDQGSAFPRAHSSWLVDYRSHRVSQAAASPYRKEEPILKRPPAGVTQRYIPPPSLSLYGLSFPFAFLIAMSVSPIPLLDAPEQMYPHFQTQDTHKCTHIQLGLYGTSLDADRRQASKNPNICWGFGHSLEFPWTLSEELVAVDAVCTELVSARIPWYQGIPQGKRRIERRSRRE